MDIHPVVAQLMRTLRELRELRGMSAEDIERHLIMGPGWVDAFESGRIVPAIDVLLAILSMLGADAVDLSIPRDGSPEPATIRRKLYAEPAEDGVIVHFDYADHDAIYRLHGATLEEFDRVLLVLRDGLSRSARSLNSDQAEAVKTDAVANAFLAAVHAWPTANPSDLWYFLIYRAYLDPFNHPASESRRDFGQSWKRTGGWALERVLVSHYRSWLSEQGVNLFIAGTEEKQRMLGELQVDSRLEADKVDVLVTVHDGSRDVCVGVVHVKASFAERRTDDVPMSQALVRAGYLSPLWTMDCKSAPSAVPSNRGELGWVLSGPEDRRSAKRKDIEDDGYFSACFSYNRNTRPTPAEQESRGRVFVCDFQNPADAFGQFVLREARRIAGR